MLWGFQGCRVCQPLSGEEWVLSKPGTLLETASPPPTLRPQHFLMEKGGQGPLLSSGEARGSLPQLPALPLHKAVCIFPLLMFPST